MMTTVFIISAPSGSGKSTLVKEIRKRVDNLEFSISYTTRAPRGSERDGREYFFITREQFEDMIAKGEFLEHAEVYEENYYGTARRFLEKAEQEGSDLLLDIDVQGADEIRRKIPDSISIFVLPPNRAELERRLRERGQNSEAVIRQRLEAAGREIENYGKYGYILVNDRLDESVKALEAILLSERLKRLGRTDAALSNTAKSYRLENVRERLQPILQSFGKTAASVK
ncbi:MAG: guanylate kinase [Acidobacteria bacterium]|nr:guanylate kinase [Acidobacteriota bacterium]